MKSADVETLLARHEYLALRAFVERIRNELPADIQQCLLFGSKARGDSHRDSDLDVLLIIDSDDWRLKHRVSSITADIALEYGVRIDPRVIAAERLGIHASRTVHVLREYYPRESSTTAGCMTPNV